MLDIVAILFLIEILEGVYFFMENYSILNFMISYVYEINLKIVIFFIKDVGVWSIVVY